MAKPISEGRLLYHLTSIDNLGGIFEKGLLSRSNIKPNKDIADSEIIKKRKELDILDYVPFHFMAPSPFAGAVEKKNRTKDFVYITVSRILAQRNNYKIIPCHPLHINAIGFQLYDYSEGYRRINWELMNKRNYQDEESKNTCMAECLAYQAVKPKDFNRIFVKNAIIQDKVQKKYSDFILENSIIVDIQPYFFSVR